MSLNNQLTVIIKTFMREKSLCKLLKSIESSKLKNNNQFNNTDSDVVLNFFIGKTDSIKDMGGWNPLLKIGEYLEFFVRFKQAGLKAGFTPNLVASHFPERSPNYKLYRERGVEYFKIMIDYHDIKKIVSTYPEKNKKVEIYFDSDGQFISKETDCHN